MGYSKFSILLAARLVLIMAMLLGLTYLIYLPGYVASTTLVLLIVVGLSFEVYRFVSKTNAEVSRFLDAARYADFSQRFQLQSMGAGFGELGDTFTDILSRFRDVRTAQESTLRHHKALIEHVPMPLVSVYANDAITLWNNAARRLFGSAHVTKLEDLKQFGDDFHRNVLTLEAGERRLVSCTIDGMEHRISMAAATVVVEGKKERLINLQDIQSELDAAQLQAWQDLVRVLTHEIMNSITPVASLAKTTVDLVSDVQDQVSEHPEVQQELLDIKDAVETVARRSDSLMSFVSSYRRLTSLPAPKREIVGLEDLFAQVERVAAEYWPEDAIAFQVSVHPNNLELNADPGMVEQILLNLIKNAAQAIEEQTPGRDERPQIHLSARINNRGRCLIEVADNGPGIAPDISSKIFIPFYTTKREGSGVGLALTRQIMIAHGGSVAVESKVGVGTKFTLTF